MYDLLIFGVVEKKGFWTTVEYISKKKINKLGTFR